MERSKLVCTEDDMTSLKERLHKKNIVDHCTTERANTTWKINTRTNFTVFASLLKYIPMGCKETELP